MPESYNPQRNISPVRIRNSELDMLRLDEAFPESTGNKWFKLRYNIVQAREKGYHTLLSFGGAFSNHIHALSVIGKQEGFRTIGVIRGEEDDANPTIASARKNGMELFFVPREQYRNKTHLNFIEELKIRFGNFYLLPEGGTNQLAVRGCSEILNGLEKMYDRIFCAVGTGGTLAGFISTPGLHARIEGIVVLKGSDTVRTIIESFLVPGHAAWELNDDYHFGGYAKFNNELISFIRMMKKQHGIPLDPVYTGKVLYAVDDMLASGRIKRDERVLVVHTGGLQGIAGWEYRFGKI